CADDEQDDVGCYEGEGNGQMDHQIGRQEQHPSAGGSGGIESAEPASSNEPRRSDQPDEGNGDDGSFQDAGLPRDLPQQPGRDDDDGEKESELARSALEQDGGNDG